jgi:hypothetical protein
MMFEEVLPEISAQISAEKRRNASPKFSLSSPKAPSLVGRECKKFELRA